MYDIQSDVPLMKICEYCFAVLKEDGTCPTEGCIHDEMEELLKDDKDTVD